MKHGYLLSVLVFLWLCPGIQGDQSLSTSFDEANKLYEEGKYTEAIAGYTKLLHEKGVSPSVYFNLGNAYFKAGQPGQAIVCYRLAQRLAPRDPDIRANLRFARDSVGGSAEARWRLVNILTLNELTVITAVLFWMWLMVLAAGQLRRDWAPSLRMYRWLLGTAAVIMIGWLGAVIQGRLGSPAAVVVAREATVRYGPFEEAQRFYTARDGTELAVLDRKDSWLQVADPTKRVGWVTSKEVVLLPRG